MKKVLMTYPQNCIACHACESVCSNLYFKVDDPAFSRIRITEAEPEPHMNACNQCGICVQTCPTLALTINSQGVVMLNKNLCISCYMCVASCPTGSMFRHLGGLAPFKCIACGSCTEACPADAISIAETKEI
ncbi:MAG: 4Fe-4S binding protein [Candidatus Syntrophosphaera sp.]|nr:4Fe-4S binding protein [Candidatus Syntrophosphaera sp.]